MRYSKEHKKQTRERIVEAAGRVFKRRGYQGGGVDAVMKDAGLTHGGFYAHFRNKEALFSEVLSKASQKIRRTRNQLTEGLEGRAWVRAMVEVYLSPQHQQHVDAGCVIPPLVSEMERLGEAPKRTFEKELLAWKDELEEHLHHLPEEQREPAALGVIATCVGSMALARAVADEALSERLLHAGRTMADCAFLADDPGGLDHKNPETEQEVDR